MENKYSTKSLTFACRLARNGHATHGEEGSNINFLKIWSKLFFLVNYFTMRWLLALILGSFGSNAHGLVCARWFSPPFFRSRLASICQIARYMYTRGWAFCKNLTTYLVSIMTLSGIIQSSIRAYVRRLVRSTDPTGLSPANSTKEQKPSSGNRWTASCCINHVVNIRKCLSVQG